MKLLDMHLARGQTAPKVGFELFLLGLLSLLWGAWYPLVKVAVATITPITLVAIQVSIASIVLWIVIWCRGYRIPRSRRIWTAFFIQSGLISILPWTMISWGQQFVDSGLAAILNSTAPVFVFLFTHLWTRHEAASLGKFAGAIIGLMLIPLGGRSMQDKLPFGCFLAPAALVAILYSHQAVSAYFDFLTTL